MKAEIRNDRISWEIRNDRRLRILQVLVEMTDTLCNEAMIKTMLVEFGHAVSSDRLRADMEWLEEHELVRVQRWRPMVVVDLTRLGVSVANGRASQPGIAQPTTVDSLMEKAFNTQRDPRSPEYQAGVRAALEFRLNKVRIPTPYPPASAASDAYHAGIGEGHRIWAAL